MFFISLSFPSNVGTSSGVFTCRWWEYSTIHMVYIKAIILALMTISVSADESYPVQCSATDGVALDDDAYVHVNYTGRYVSIEGVIDSDTNATVAYFMMEGDAYLFNALAEVCVSDPQSRDGSVVVLVRRLLGIQHDDCPIEMQNNEIPDTVGGTLVAPLKNSQPSGVTIEAQIDAPPGKSAILRFQCTVNQ